MHRSSRRFAKAANLLTMTHVGTTVRFRKKILTSQRRAKLGHPAWVPQLCRDSSLAALAQNDTLTPTRADMGTKQLIVLLLLGVFLSLFQSLALSLLLCRLRRACLYRLVLVLGVVRGNVFFELLLLRLLGGLLLLLLLVVCPHQECPEEQRSH